MVAAGDITYTPCPTRTHNIFGQVKLLDPTQSPVISGATNYFLLKGSVDNGVNQNLIGSEQGLTITQTTNNPFIFGRYESLTVGGAYTGGNLQAAYWELSNRNSPNATTANLTGIGADVEIDSLAASGIGGVFSAITGGSGGGATPLIIGVNGIGGTHNTTNPLVIGGRFELRNGLAGGGNTTIGIGAQSQLINYSGTTTDGRGFSCDTWLLQAGSVTSSSCIYADTTIDTFGTTHYFINSLSASPSKINGDFAIVNNLKGVILKSPNGTCYRIAVDNAGSLSTASVTCP